MAKYLLIYRTTGQPMPEMTPEQAEAGMQKWMDWAGRAGAAIVDMGAPLTPVNGSSETVGGYSVLEAADADALAGLLEGHPHTEFGGTVEIHEFQAIPGM
jgi:hypothetical protein